MAQTDPQTPTAAIHDNEYLICLAKTEYREAYNTGDVERLLEVFGPQFVDWSEGEPGFYGEEAPRTLRLRATELFARYTVQLTINMARITIVGDSAFDRGWHKVRLRDKVTGKESLTVYRYFETWAKQNGAWKIVFFMSNKECPPKIQAEETSGLS